MLKGKSFSTGFVFLGLLALGCRSQTVTPPPPTPTANPAPTQSNSNPADKSSQPPAPDLDESALLAHKTSQYANEVAPLLNKRGAHPATQPSVVQWVQPANAPQAPASPPQANQAVTLAAAKLTEDSSVPLILPESADHIAPTSAATQPSAAVGVSTDEYEKRLQQMVRDYPRDLGAQLDYQLLRFVRQESTPDQAEVAQLSLEDRELLSALMDGLTNFRNSVRAQANPMLSRKIQPLLEMADRLRSQTELNIPTIALCTRVDSYGVYKPRSPRFVVVPDHDHEVIVYAEVDNFTSIRNAQKLWETRLRQELVLYSDTGQRVWPDKPDQQLFVDLARNRRHDFFIPRKIVLPATLAVGNYLLKMTLTDEQSHRLAEATTPLEIVAP